MSVPIRMKAGDAWPTVRAQITRDGVGMPLVDGIAVTLLVWEEGSSDVVAYPAEVENPDAEAGEGAGWVHYRWGTDEPIDASLVTDTRVFLYQFVASVPDIGTFTAPTVGADYLIVYPREI